MRHAKSLLASLCVLLMPGTPAGFAADQTGTPPPAGNPPQAGATRPGFFGRIASPYTGRIPPMPGMANSTRLDSLLRAGNLYLSLADSIALALENNLDRRKVDDGLRQ